MNMNELLHMAHSLGKEMSKSEAWLEVLAARDKLMVDPVAYQLLARFQDASLKIERKHKDGLVIPQAEIDNFEKLQEQLASNALVAEMQEAQERFNKIMQLVYRTLDQALEGSCEDSCNFCH